MRKIVTALLLFSTCTTYSQDVENPVLKVAKKYFRSHPFDMKFSSFISSLQRDPWFTVGESYRRTDSSFFFLSGTYKSFNPFQFIPKELKLIVAEEEISHADSLKTLDTIIDLELIAIADSGAVGLKAVQKEFKRFHNSQSRQFSYSNYKFLPARGPVITESYNYFVFPYSVAPVTVAWGLYPASNQYAFTITIRFKLKQNVADYIITPDELKAL